MVWLCLGLVGAVPVGLLVLLTLQLCGCGVFGFAFLLSCLVVPLVPAFPVCSCWCLLVLLRAAPRRTDPAQSLPAVLCLLVCAAVLPAVRLCLCVSVLAALLLLLLPVVGFAGGRACGRGWVPCVVMPGPPAFTSPE